MPFARGPSPCSVDHVWQAPQSLRLCFGTPFSEKLLLLKQADHNPSCNTNTNKSRPQPPRAALQPLSTTLAVPSATRAAVSLPQAAQADPAPTAPPRSSWLIPGSPEKSPPLPLSACAPPAQAELPAGRAGVPHDKGPASGRSLSSERIYEFLTLSFRDANGHAQPSYGQAGVRCPRPAQRREPDVSGPSTLSTKGQR